MRRSIVFSLCVVVAFATGGGVAAQDRHEAVGPQLPDRVRGLLLQEMNAILGASQQILGALVRGEHAVVAEQASAIHDSFILEQEMTASDRKALKQAVPADFIARDRRFHELTGELARAAREGDSRREQQLFKQMVDACTGCHARYARDRFPGLHDPARQ